MWLPILQQGQHVQRKAELYQQNDLVTVSDLQRIEAQLSRNRIEQQPLLNQWQQRGGWLRVWTNPLGKVHRYLQCAEKRCSEGQQPQLLPALSGWTDDLVISHAKLDVCLDCFPKAKQNKAWMGARSAQVRQSNCPGSTRKPSAEDRCSACDQQTFLTKAGRVRAHRPSSAASNS